MLAAAVIPPMTRVAIHFWGFNRVHEVVWRNVSSRPEQTEAINTDEIVTLTSLMNAAANRSPIYTSCLHRSLAFWWLLNRRGVTSELRIGVYKQAGKLQAHAWLEKDGTPLSDSRDSVQAFTAFDQVVEPVINDTQ